MIFTIINRKIYILQNKIIFKHFRWLVLDSFDYYSEGVSYDIHA